MEEQIEKCAFNCTVMIQNAWRNFKLRKKALEEAAHAADLLRGRKQRMRDSVNRKFLADYMKYAENYGLQEAIKQGGGVGEEMIFANAIEAFNRRLKTEKRDFVITNKALYFVSRKKKGATVLYKVTKRTELQNVTQISLSTFADDYIVIHCNDFDQAFTDIHKTEIATKILNYAKQLTNRDIPVQFQAVINYKIKTGDMRALQFSAGNSAQPVVTKTGKAVQVQVGPGLDANTDTTPSAWKKKLERLKAGYKGPQQVKSQIAAVRAQKGEMSAYDEQIQKAKSPRGDAGGYGYGGGGAAEEEEEEEGYHPAPVVAVKQPKMAKAGVKKGVKVGAGEKGVKKVVKKKADGAAVVAPPPAAATQPAAAPAAVKAPGAKQGVKKAGAKKMVKKAGGAPNAPPRAAAAPSLPQAEALYEYTAQAADEMSFAAGEILSITQQDPSGWWEGIKEDGTKAWLPATYVRLLQ